MGRPCSICRDGERHRLAGELIAGGASDQAVADRIGGVNRMAVARHRHNHILTPARAVAAMAGKGQDVAADRAEMLAAAEAGDPAAFIALTAIVADLKRVHGRLERTADAAELDNQRLAVASLSAQQLRAVEVRAKMGGVGGYAPGQIIPAGGAGGFSVNIHIGAAVERFTASAAPAIDADMAGADQEPSNG